MKILIASLQVSTHSSRGHLHPAIELALECQRRGHEAVILPLPSALGEEDNRVLKNAKIRVLLPPILPSGVIKTGAELARFASDPTQTWKAYHSFLVAPLIHQYDGVLSILAEENPDVLLYDLLVYSAPLAARSLGIPDIGYCAGLKLVAPEKFQEPYKEARNKLEPDLHSFLTKISATAKFHYLELLSKNTQLVFSTEALLGKPPSDPPLTTFAGPLPMSADRGDDVPEIKIPDGDFAILSFGSVFDPADFPKILEALYRATATKKLKLLIASKKLSENPGRLPPHAEAYPYLPIPALLDHARVVIHHGGANSFSEAVAKGCPQIIVPLATDQPIQAYYLKRAGAGFALRPPEVTTESLEPLLEKILGQDSGLYDAINRLKLDYTHLSGAKTAVTLAERMKD